MLHDLAPVGGPHDVAEGRRQGPRVRVQAAHRHHFEPEAELESDFVRVFRQDRHRPGSDVAEADDANFHFFHV